MATAALMSQTLSPGGTAGDQDESNMSSPLSDVDDKDSEGADIRHLRLGDDDVDRSSMPAEDGEEASQPASDSESALSDAKSDINSEANDTEAETERLYETPRNRRQRDVIIDQFSQGQVLERTPSKLRRTTAVDDNEDEIEVDGDREDDINDGYDTDSVSNDHGSTGAIYFSARMSNSANVDHDDSKQASQERKRKRSPAIEHTDTEQPSRKRLGSLSATKLNDETDSVVVEGGDMENPQSNVQSGEDDDEAEEEDQDEEEEGEEEEGGEEGGAEGGERQGADGRGAIEAESIVQHNEPSRYDRTKKQRPRDGVSRVLAATDQVEDTSHDRDAEILGREREQADDEVEVEVDVEEGIDVATKNAEELERKQAAYKDWTYIEDMFGTFRDRLYKDRLQRLEEEEESLLADNPTHPEFLNMKQCLDDRLGRKLQQFTTEYDFRIEAHERRAVAQRSQIWSQFFQAVREKREQALEQLNAQWYDVQSARRSAHSLPEYGLLFPKDGSERLRNAIAYNSEVSNLAGIAKYEGFPAGPQIKGASQLDLENDLNIMEQNRRGRQKSLIQSREEYQPPAFNRLGPAGEQFLKDTPWANPNHSAHRIHQQPVAPTDAITAEPGTLNSTKTAGGASKAVDTAKLPINGLAVNFKRVSTDAGEPTKAGSKSAVPQTKKGGPVPGNNRGSKTAAT